MSIAIYLIIFLGISFGFFKLFPLAGQPAWKGLVPIYNLFVAIKILERPWWWIFLFIFPGVNVVMLMVVCQSLARRFGKHQIPDVLMSIFIPFIYLPYLGFQDVKFQPKMDWSDEDQRKERDAADKAVFVVSTLGLGAAFVLGLKKLLVIKDKVGKPTFYKEWGDSIVFAIVAAAIIRTYVFEAFTIPTSSMEKSLLIGDYLFVSKMAYGPKVPQTPLSFPLAHHSFPGTNLKSYLEWIHLPYQRLPGFGDVERNDIVVFNYPEGDTVLVQYQSNLSYNRAVRLKARELQQQDQMTGKNARSFEAYKRVARKLLKNNLEYVVRPVDKRENYIKRCVAVPGDEIYIEAGKLHINGETAYIPTEFQFNYLLQSSTMLNKQSIKDELNVNLQDFALDNNPYQAQPANGFVYNFPLTMENYDKAKSLNIMKSVKMRINYPEAKNGLHIFPNTWESSWTEDFWGPLSVPSKGETVALTLANLPFYERIITVYEGHSLEVNNGVIMIDGANASEYTFEMDYYFMMGDNRHNSADSRFWGFVPEDHIVGKASFIWLSMDPERGLFDGKIRFSRMFSVPE